MAETVITKPAKGSIVGPISVILAGRIEKYLEATLGSIADETVADTVFDRFIQAIQNEREAIIETAINRIVNPEAFVRSVKPAAQ